MFGRRGRHFPKARPIAVRLLFSRSVQPQLVIRQGANLPHWRRDGAVYSVVFRLADSLPLAVLEFWRKERDALLRCAAQRGGDLSDIEAGRLAELFETRIDRHLDKGHGECVLRDPAIAAIVAGALEHFDGQRYRLCAWCVMPNHVHAIVRPEAGRDLSKVLQGWKGFTGRAASKLLERPGPFWQHEPYDHLIRNGIDLARQVRYVMNNPAAAGLIDWPWMKVNEPLVESWLQMMG